MSFPRLAQILLFSVFLQGFASADPGKTGETFNIPVDIQTVKQGDWVEHDWTWSSNGRSAKGTMRVACVRANETEVWLEVCTDTARGVVDLERVVRKTREVKSAWRLMPGGTPESLEIIHPGAQGRVPKPMEPDLVHSEGDTEATEEEIASKKLKAEHMEFTCDEKRGKSTIHHEGVLVLSEDVPFSCPPESKEDPGRIPGRDVLDLPRFIQWKTKPKLKGGVVRSEHTTTCKDQDYDFTEKRTESLKAFGHDAKPAVVVEGETDEQSLR